MGLQYIGCSDTRGNSKSPPETGNTTSRASIGTDSYSNIFLVPKKDGGQRPVINLKAFNDFINPEHFKMEGIKDLLEPKDWLTKVDLKGAYFTIPIHPTHQNDLKFQFQGKTYHFTCLTFDLSSAPWVYTKTLKPALAELCGMGICLVAYMDDILIIANSRYQALEHSEAVASVWGS